MKADKPRIFGWCADRKHVTPEHKHGECWGSYVTITPPQVTRHCECPCHEEERSA